MMMLFMIFLPDGIVPSLARLLAAESVDERCSRRRRASASSFGGVTAVAGVSFAVDAGEIFAIIGPNGAGKTTLFNLISGIYRAARGRVALDGEDVTGLPPHRWPRAGSSRTFQNLQIFFRMTALENVMVGRHLHEQARIAGASAARCRRCAGRTARRAAKARGTARASSALARLRRPPAGSAALWRAQAARDRARARHASRSVLLLDEPAAGCNPVETAEIDALIQQIAAHGITVVLVEHDMKLVMKISDRIHRARPGPHAGRRHGREVRAQSGGDRGLSRRARAARSRACSRLRTCPAATAASRRCTTSSLDGAAGRDRRAGRQQRRRQDHAAARDLGRAADHRRRDPSSRADRSHALPAHARVAPASCRCPKAARCSRRCRSRTTSGSAPGHAAMPTSRPISTHVYATFPDSPKARDAGRRRCRADSSRCWRSAAP